ncbi:MAG: hypothetical protein DWB56_13805 [Candidatus Jettenia sp.]|uniref:Uncharacterized protein n=1 Tax=Candidatus Jettenia caeni TaxID=247490 RepID=I3IHY5_9BACT|nr:hypothetical protein [Candidatus Jettenia sp. AMX1]MBC6930010.1 hypothetical protein [Candidatus Jettenia sp.]WKZ16655.1 MAG: hypothetical protein QY317_04945 [Candidatus Jettenia caeni]KAA0248401.1 MAG: hypothetical protein EDM77_12740 [Candidatus Jettenia sp. AMX1]MCE7881620.1 hypothetical protein [Candidatus Jettenia sp. AMX1]MCQ3928289.1 hypothetical protein [Candidatus Jettenia sp.]
MIRTTSPVFPEWLGWLGIIVGSMYLFGIPGRLIWAPLGTARGVAFFFFLAFVVLTGLRLLKVSSIESSS